MTPAEREAFLLGAQSKERGRGPFAHLPPEERAATWRMLDSLTPPARKEFRRRMQTVAPAEREALRQRMLAMAPEERSDYLLRSARE
jgi:hypothetical protein